MAQSMMSKFYPLFYTWMLWQSELRQPSSAPHHSLLLLPDWRQRIHPNSTTLNLDIFYSYYFISYNLSAFLRASLHFWCSVSPSTLWVWLCSWRAVWGPTHDSLFPAGQLLGHMCCLHRPKKKSKEVFIFFKCTTSVNWQNSAMCSLLATYRQKWNVLVSYLSGWTIKK